MEKSRLMVGRAVGRRVVSSATRKREVARAQKGSRGERSETELDAVVSDAASFSLSEDGGGKEAVSTQIGSCDPLGLGCVLGEGDDRVEGMDGDVGAFEFGRLGAMVSRAHEVSSPRSY